MTDEPKEKIARGLRTLFPKRWFLPHYNYEQCVKDATDYVLRERKQAVKKFLEQLQEETVEWLKERAKRGLKK